MADSVSYVDMTKGVPWIMRDLRFPLMWLLVSILSGSCLAADLFSSEVQRQAFVRALAREDAKYDPAQQMLQAEFSSPGYHSTLAGGTVHRTRESLEYAVALLDSGAPERLERAEAILRRVIALQDQDPNSKTYGIWPWFLEEPLDKMAPPDWNWADFCGTQLLQVAIDHLDRLPADLQQKVKGSILHAARSIQRRDVDPSYTNIALMGTYVTLVAGERFDVRELRDYGRQRLRRFFDYTQEKGSFTEYNSPTYTVVAIEEISRMLRHVRDEESRELLGWLNNFAWRHVACRFHEPTRQWAGPHSRCYSTLLRPATLAFLQRALGEDFKLAPPPRSDASGDLFLPEAQAWESLDAHRIAAVCPVDLRSGFQAHLTSSEVIEVFVRNPRAEHDIIGTTYLHPEFTLGSVNIGDLWNQRRPVVGYWRTPGGPAAVRLRLLHDDYDYASASIFTVQEQADILGAVLFATDRGDTHISLDKIANATIRARDLRLRLDFEGAVGGLALTGELELGEPIRFTSGLVEGTFCIPAAEFAGLPVRFETRRESGATWIDLVLYHGPERPFDFTRIAEAAIVFTLSMAPKGTAPENAGLSVYGSIASELTVAGIDSPRRTWSFQRSNNPTLALTIPTKPLPTREQKTACSAKSAEQNPWKSSF